MSRRLVTRTERARSRVALAFAIAPSASFAMIFPMTKSDGPQLNVTVYSCFTICSC